MEKTRPLPDDTGGTDIKSTVLEHDIAEPYYGPREAIARCPSCNRETLWCDREHFTHKETCEVGE